MKLFSFKLDAFQLLLTGGCDAHKKETHLLQSAASAADISSQITCLLVQRQHYHSKSTTNIHFTEVSSAKVKLSLHLCLVVYEMSSDWSDTYIRT